MRGPSSLAFLVSTGILGTSSGALTAIDVTPSANGWDTRTSGYGCAPDSCIASNAVDGSVDYDSRWSCNPGYFDDFDACELTLDFSGPQDIKEIRLSLWKGDERTRLINVIAGGQVVATIESSGMTEGIEPYPVTATQVSSITLQGAGTNDDTYNGWLSILEVEVMVESNLGVSPPSPAPADEEYVGCFIDMIDDRIMSTVTIMEDLTSEDCRAHCRDMNYLYYALQQGNECWCSSCDLTDGATNTAYDRHGEGSCSTPCAGEASSECGGDMAFSLFLTGNCGPTPAPTVAILDTDCPAGSTPYALQVTLTYSADPELYVGFDVTEPSGYQAYFYDMAEGVGAITQSEDETMTTYTTMNGLADDAPVLGDYTINIWGSENAPYALTARVAGEVVLETRGVATSGVDDEFTVTVTEYAESDCELEGIGLCPENTFSEDGTPPCTGCTEGRTAEKGSTVCSVAAFDDLRDIPDEVAAAILADAVGGFSGYVWFPSLTGHGKSFEQFSLDYRYYEVTAEDEGMLQLTGTVGDEDFVFADSAALMVYVYSKSTGDVTIGQGSLDFATGEFSITVEDLPVGSIEVYFSFSVLDPSQDPQYFGPGSVYSVNVAHDACTSPLVLKVEWDGETVGYSSFTTSDDSFYDSVFDLYVQEPDGNVVSPRSIGNFGFSSATAYGPDTQSYSVYGGDANAVGEYTARVFPWVFLDVPFTLTAEVGGETVWVEEIMWYGANLTSLSYSGWDESPSPFGSFFVSLDSVPAC